MLGYSWLKQSWQRGRWIPSGSCSEMVLQQCSLAQSSPKHLRLKCWRAATMLPKMLQATDLRRLFHFSLCAGLL